MKEKALFYLNRKVKELEGEVELDHKKLATEGVPYDHRKQLQYRADQREDELKAWRWIWDVVNGH